MEKLIIEKISEENSEDLERLALEFVAADKLMCSENSLITNKQYISYLNFHEWYKIYNKLNNYSYEKNLIKLHNYLIYHEIKGKKKVVAIIEIRENLPDNLDIIGNISIDINPLENENIYYEEILKIALEETKKLNIDCGTILSSSANLDEKFPNFKIQKKLNNNVYIYKFYNKKIYDTIFDIDISASYTFYLSENLYNLENGIKITSYQEIKEVLKKLKKPFLYLYIYDYDNELYTMVKVTDKQIDEIMNQKKLIK